jgi:hypothetical protein
MMAKHIYVEVDNLYPLLEWLQTRPEGKLNVMIGGTTDSIPTVLKYLGSDLSLAKWIYDKTLQGEFNIQSMPDGAELPIGIVLED